MLDRFQLAIVAHDEPAEIMKASAAMTGFPEMPPLWSLGYQQSHRTIRNPEEVMGVVKTRLAGKADMGQVSAAVKAALAP